MAIKYLSFVDMKLHSEYFELIKNGKKTIEVRCYDDKRKQLKIGDTIRFTKLFDHKNTIYAKVIGLKKFDTFEELFSYYPMSAFGDPEKTVADMLEQVNVLYSKRRQEAGALAIVLEV
mgnify:CR=1 FL=1